MKIAILVPNYIEAGGDARVVKIQAKDFFNNGHKVTIFTLNSDIESSNIPIINMGMPKKILFQRIYRLLFPLDIIKIIKIIHLLREFDIIVAHLYPMTWIGMIAKKMYGKKYIFWYHGIDDPENFKGIIQKVYIKFFIFMTKISILNTDNIIAVSYFGQKGVKEFFKRDSEVIYNTVDERFHPGIDGTIIRQKHGLGDFPVILSVGRVMPQKGFHILIDIFNEIQKKIPDAKLVIVGQTTYTDYLRELKEKSNDSVIFAGYVKDEMPLYYAMCDLYATCSLRECHNLPILEAQACGKSVIAFNNPPFNEEVNKNGFLIENGNFTEFINTCIKVLNMRRIVVGNK